MRGVFAALVVLALAGCEVDEELERRLALRKVAAAAPDAGVAVAPPAGAVDSGGWPAPTTIR